MLIINVETDHVERLLASVDMALWPTSLARFLATDVDRHFKTRAKNRFKTEGDAASGAWAPLSYATLRYRKSQGFPAAHPINKRTGELENYITGTKPDVRVESFGATLTLPSNPPSGELAEKFFTAQFGKDNPDTVARPVLATDVSDLSRTLQLLAIHIAYAIARG